MKIPQYDLDGLGGEFKLTQELEESTADFFGVRYCIMVNSGTTAIFLALKATGAKKVAIPCLTMFGTATAAELAGCEIVFVSNNELPSNVDAYVHVSLNGRDCSIAETVAANPNITIIEDACQSFGSEFRGKFLGTFGKVGCFSFSPHKILSAGNGGCIITNNEEIARSVRALKNFGRESGGADNHESIGYNFKFTDIQAAFMLKQFKQLPERIRRKKEIYARYFSSLSDIMRNHIGTPWFVDIYVDHRDDLATFLIERSIGTRKMYPLLTTQKPFSHYKVIGDSTADEFYSDHGLWLPSSIGITNKEINYVVDTIKTWLNRNETK